MPDITMCTNSKCVKRKECFRFCATPKEFNQSYQLFEPKNNLIYGFECDKFIKING